MVISVALVFDLVNALLAYDCAKFAAVYAEFAYELAIVALVALVLADVYAELEYDCARLADMYAELA